MRIERPVFLALAFVVLGACSSQQHFTVLSNRLVRTADLDLEDSARLNRVSKEQVLEVFVLVPIGEPPHFELLLDQALAEGGGDVMRDVTVTLWRWYIPLIYGQHGLRIEGEVAETRHPDA